MFRDVGYLYAMRRAIKHLRDLRTRLVFHNE